MLWQGIANLRLTQRSVLTRWKPGNPQAKRLDAEWGLSGVRLSEIGL